MTAIPEHPAPNFIIADTPGHFPHIGPEDEVIMWCSCHLGKGRKAVIWIEDARGYMCSVPEDVCL